MPRFHVHDTFALRDKGLFVLSGFVLEGALAVDMTIHIPFNSSLKMYAAIDHIDYVHRPDGDITCLCIKYSVPDELTLWEALPIKNQTLEVA